MILDRIGSGAMGTVFAAYDPRLDRKVAVKLVRTGGAESTALVAREARALARLAHPNVVGIHDVGELDDEIYIVMELASGIPLRTWIAGDRHWRDVARVIREAALGLAAAHRAQLIHRDVKPDNLLIGLDRTRVVDFGLAQDRADGDDGQSAGTPSYMAPEVLDGQPASEASDQFSLGVTLYEALYGVRPHGGATREELRVTARTAASARPSRAAPAEAIVRSGPPAWLHAIVARMLAAEPQKRFASLDAVATALGRDRRRRTRVIALVATASIASAALGVIAYRHQTAHDPCDGGPARESAVWSAETAARVKTSLGTAPWAAKALEGLDATAAQWVTSFRHVCEASRIRGDQSDTLLDLRMRCLDRSLARFDALAAALAAPLDAPSRVEATGAVAELPPPLACETVDDPAELALPSDPARRARVTAAERTLDRAWAAYALGHYALAGDALRELRETAELGAPALTAAVLLLAASVEARVGTPAAARTLLESALTAAAAAHTAELEASVWARLLRHELFAGSPTNVIAWAPFAHAAAVRAGHEGAEIDGIVGEALRDAGQLDAARQRLAHALASKDPLRGDQRALIEMNAGSVELAAGAPGAAEQAFTRALALAREALGDAHPTLAIYLDKLAAADRARGRIVAALVLHDQSLAVRIAAYGATDRSVATSLLQRSRTLIEANRLDDAAHDASTALEIRTAKLGPQSPRLGEIIAVQGEIAAARGERDAADLLYRRAAELDPRLDLRARRAAVGGSAVDLPDTIDPLTVDRGAALAVRLGRETHDAARPLATALRARILAIGPPVDPALALPVGEALYLINDVPGAMAIARAVLGQLAPEPSRSRERAQRLLDAAQQ